MQDIEILSIVNNQHLASHQFVAQVYHQLMRHLNNDEIFQVCIVIGKKMGAVENDL